MQAETAEAAKFLTEGADAGWLNPVVAREYLIDDAAVAHHDIIHNSGARGKLVLKFD